ncbi:hypothetical protein KFK09_014841 [Dendrobium nobile]|uniref:Tf2-1-like SH3-like domain-containing protein n=1 Tax=Dendrobium nobile TaxID=94219 RepID=A0A8T3B2W4_DENNO|nr:hypothetical protein KFK09_014841 [Dendrobium nobile]
MEQIPGYVTRRTTTVVGFSRTSVGGYIHILHRWAATFKRFHGDFCGGVQIEKVCSFHPPLIPLHCGDRGFSFHHRGGQIDGVTEAIVSDRDEMFLGYFWRELFRLPGIPQTDGYTKVISSKVLYGRDPPYLVHFGSSNSLVFSVEEYLEERDRVLEELKRHLLRAKHIMKKKGDGHRKDIPFEVGERVFFKLRSYRQKTVTNRRNEKLAPRYVRPYEVLEKVEAITYWLKLSPTTTIHPVFHVSKLRRVIEDYTASSELLVSLTEDLEVVLEPLKLMGVC